VAAVGFAVIYIVAVALSVPGGAVLTIAGGFLFGKWIDTALVLVAATIGATLLFLAARTALAPLLRARAAPWLVRLEAGVPGDAHPDRHERRILHGVRDGRRPWLRRLRPISASSAPARPA